MGASVWPPAHLPVEQQNLMDDIAQKSGVSVIGQW